MYNSGNYVDQGEEVGVGVVGVTGVTESRPREKCLCLKVAGKWQGGTMIMWTNVKRAGMEGS